MQWHSRKLVSVICEAALERQLITEVQALGIGGYTISDVRGGGTRGVRGGEWEAERSIELKAVCDGAAAEQLCSVLMERYALHFALVLYVSDVGVLRAGKFT